MKANKVTVTITVEVLDIQAEPHMIRQALEQIENEFEGGALTALDGDTVNWSTDRVSVVI